MTRFEADIFKLRRSLAYGLPGVEAHQRLAPQGRKAGLPDFSGTNKEVKTACVMLLLYPQQNQSMIILIERAEAGLHAGQIALPGGKMEPGETELQTAIRETREEIGVSLAEAQVWSRLTAVYIPPSNFIVHPFFTVLQEKPTFRLNSGEVKRIIELPLDGFHGKKNLAEKEFRSSRGTRVLAPCYSLGGIEIWGATAMILSEFTSLLYPVIEPDQS